MRENKKCSCCSSEPAQDVETIIGEYICYCNKVSETDIVRVFNENKE